MNIHFYKTQNPILAKYIEGYYFISEDENINDIKYWTFPNNYVVFTCNQNIDVQVNDNHVSIQLSETENLLTSLVPKYTKPILIHYKQLINELTIYFKPLGINYFTNETDIIFSKEINVDFKLFPDFDEVLLNIFNSSLEDKIEILENYLVSKLQNKDFKLVESILLSIEDDFSIQEIAEQHEISRQYLNKVFKNHVGKSLSEYRKIHKFRQSIIQQKESKNFTELSQNSFYDQSHFIRSFKDLTAIKPNTFFKNVDTEKENIWLFF
ncbi:AraC family transcriptional regulator [Soonwooa sp.]|uniref:helix-turn-helix domain-containing protein n=1 Tax=Soonwooa sp. TaxID=1938592 RepID=UPI002613CD8E|nr:AraC family transcriptional regulator [Soonwooa sp.]